MESWLSVPSWGQACRNPAKTDVKPPASGGANHQEQHGCHLQAPSGRCECFVLPLGFTILSSVSVVIFGVPLPSRVQPTSSPLHLLLLSTVMTSP